MQLSDYRPAHKIILFSSTAEEWGYTDCNYDWLVGSTYAIQHQEQGLGRQDAGDAQHGIPPPTRTAVPWFTATQELKPWLETEIAAHPKLVGPKGAVSTRRTMPTTASGSATTTSGRWSASGIPSVCSWTPDADFWANYYHTPYDSLKLLSWSFLRRETKFHIELARSLDRGLLPYDLSTQADALGVVTSATDFTGQGVAADAVDPFIAAVATYREAGG